MRTTGGKSGVDAGREEGSAPVLLQLHGHLPGTRFSGQGARGSWNCPALCSCWAAQCDAPFPEFHELTELSKASRGRRERWEGQTQARHPQPSAWPQTKPRGTHLVFSVALSAVLPCLLVSLFSSADYSVISGLFPVKGSPTRLSCF